jgi:D-alanine-D-alanine ligase
MGGRERILVLHNAPVLPENHRDSYSEIEVLDNANAVAEVLREDGYEVRSLSLGRDPSLLIDTLRDDRIDVVFNLFEGTADHYITEAYVAGLLDWLDVPFTGCPCESLLLAQKKHVTKRLLQQAGVPTAPFLIVDAVPEKPPALRWPLFVKPACQDSSIGIDQGSVVTNMSELEGRVRYVLASYGKPALIEEFILGRELTLGVVELPERRPLPITEVTFRYDKPGLWPILSYDAKWESEGCEYLETDYLFGVSVEPELRERLEWSALTAFELLGARDYARADFRVRGNEVFLLEMNPNPSFAPHRGLTWALGATDITHRDFSLAMIRNALKRGRRRARPAVA